MKKLLIIALLIVGCVFGDTIKYKSSLFVTDTKENVEYLGVGKNQSICFKSNNDIDCIPCKFIKEVRVGGILLDSSNDFDCNEPTYYGKSQNEVRNKDKKISHKLGGALIAIGGAILINNLDKECDDCITTKQKNHFSNKVKAQNKMGYLFIIMGGLIIAIGN